jgi:hypothetical protein
VFIFSNVLLPFSAIAQDAKRTFMFALVAAYAKQ